VRVFRLEALSRFAPEAWGVESPHPLRDVAPPPMRRAVGETDTDELAVFTHEDRTVLKAVAPWAGSVGNREGIQNSHSYWRPKDTRPTPLRSKYTEDRRLRVR